MSEILLRSGYFAVVARIADYLEAVSKWHLQHKIKEASFLSKIWFRGNGRQYPHPLLPGVYRKDFIQKAKNYRGGTDEEKILNLEREVLNEFRTAGAILLNPNDSLDVYFTAQHFGMPTRLLDWTTNPLAGLFFAVENTQEHSDDGEVFVMEAKGILPPPPAGKKPKSGEWIWDVVGMRHPYIADAVGQSFWHEPKKTRVPVIAPVRPNNQPGRIGQQSSCFTLHMYQSSSYLNRTLSKIKIPAAEKGALLEQLHRLNINQFTIYNDLDHLSKDIKRARGIN